jgi:hypothetical protein
MTLPLTQTFLPLSPRLPGALLLLSLQELGPKGGSRGGHVGVGFAAVNPNSVAGLHQDGVEVVGLLWEHCIV